jgi:hypothetical protein
MAMDSARGAASPEFSSIRLDLPHLKVEVHSKAVECQQRGLMQSFKWLSEILFTMRYVQNTLRLLS